MTNTQNKVEDIMNTLEQGVEELFDSEKYINYLRVMSKFHKYSFNNCMLIYMQKPDATMVAGYKSWENNFKRHVKKGEKAIKILAPIVHKRTKVVLVDGAEEERESSFITYRATSVFDISQTEGEELPEIAEELKGTVEGFEELRAKLESVSPVPVTYESITDGSNGFYRLDKKSITVRNDLSEVHTIKTLIHEIGHAMLHDKDAGEQKDVDANTKEVQAESIAFAVCNYLGLDTSEYSFGYIAGWSKGKEQKELRSSMEVIRRTACKIIEGIAA